MQKTVQQSSSQLEKFSFSQNQHVVGKRNMVLTHRNHPVHVTSMNSTTVFGIPETSKFPKKLLDETTFKSIHLNEALDSGLITQKAYDFFMEKGYQSIDIPAQHVHFLGNSADFAPIYVGELNREVSPILVVYPYNILGDKGEIELDLGTFTDYNDRHNKIINLLVKEVKEKDYLIVYNLETKTHKYYHSSEIEILNDIQSQAIRLKFENTDLKNKHPNLYAKLLENQSLEATKLNSLNEIIS